MRKISIILFVFIFLLLGASCEDQVSQDNQQAQVVVPTVEVVEDSAIRETEPVNNVATAVSGSSAQNNNPVLDSPEADPSSLNFQNPILDNSNYYNDSEVYDSPEAVPDSLNWDEDSYDSNVSSEVYDSPEADFEGLNFR
ncbi:hypothetical protein A2223_04510 [Candidatus Falkowbacteria bacterium RIFOXYA2_FULL_35_8]|uniref:Uncharacterized protein n=1 Tax=Candidatus Falkowbacteria bacterium RIFOXYC2_FULL_36_12 TaxID=1798002 RepID=A0A1F5SWM4_9BACT|nr:MAG: hypothetical protein A2300_00660 [Candidatus Falkowbacteria bacterium RIFOXYB2_FULL_35_7]OGF30853.1 MAG: hypothetical protein A2478_00155 [Candidatus Falkowbacteria bacterium RIFOXYC2_FULL_36_12]OGF33934.1 MAG: hypothetical protein A2223_04510 [Candidatus Falkowbacteria bacterium RIFOXYA2_FULL_35_8]